MRSVTKLACLFVCLLAVCVGLVAYATSLARAPQEPVLQVSDKPEPVMIAEEAADEAEEEEEYYDDYVYYAPISYYDSDYDDLSDQEYIAFRESGGDYNSRNGRYIGKYQMDESRLDGDWSPEHQEEVAEQYMLDRYGSWEAAREFWDSHGWW